MGIGEAMERLVQDLASSHVERAEKLREIKSEVEGLVKEFGRARKEMGNALRADLARARADLESEGRELLSDFPKVRAVTRADLERAKAAWQGFASRRKEAEAVKVEARVGVPEEREEEEEERLLAAINAHPEGITLSEVARGFGVRPAVLGRAARSLVDQGKIRKEGNSYFPSDQRGRLR
jgi:hypothetical protein